MVTPITDGHGPSTKLYPGECYTREHHMLDRVIVMETCSHPMSYRAVHQTPVDGPWPSSSPCAGRTVAASILSRPTAMPATGCVPGADSAVRTGMAYHQIRSRCEGNMTHGDDDGDENHGEELTGAGSVRLAPNASRISTVGKRMLPKEGAGASVERRRRRLRPRRLRPRRLRPRRLRPRPARARPVDDCQHRWGEGPAGLSAKS